MPPMIGMSGSRTRRFVPAIGGGGGGSHPLVTDKLAHPMNFSMTKPARNTPYYDPEFDQLVTRVTDSAAQFPGASCTVPIYSTMPAWNCDMTKLLVYVQTLGEYWTINASTLAPIRSVNVSPAGLEHLVWHPTDPLLLYFPTGSTLKTHNVTTDAQATVYTHGSSIDFGGDPMSSSWDGDLWGFHAGANACTRRLSTSATTGNVSGGGSGLQAQIAPSGNYYIVNGNVYTAGGTSLLRAMTLDTNEHACMTKNAAGVDYWVTCQFGGTYDGATVVAEKISDGTITRIITDTQGWPYTPGSTHLSGLSLTNPGIVAVSCVGYPASYNGVLQQEVLFVDVNTMTLIGRVCHHHSVPGSQPDPFNYFAEPHVIIAPNGRKAIFGTNWHAPSTSIDVYMVEY